MRLLWIALICLAVSGCASTRTALVVNINHQVDAYTTTSVEYRVEGK